MNPRILVWDFPTRIFHWCLVAAFAGAMISSDSKSLLLAHTIFGYLMLALIFFRLVWGLLGSRYARFSEFVRGPSAAIGHLRSLLGGNPEKHVGHNPAGALAIVGLLLLGCIAAASGVATLNAIGGKPAKELHEALSFLMLALVVVHVLGAIVSSILLRENLVLAMITGFKNGLPADAAAKAHGMTAFLLVLVLGAFAWSLARGQLPSLLDPVKVNMQMGREHHEEQDHEDEDR